MAPESGPADQAAPTTGQEGTGGDTSATTAGRADAVGGPGSSQPRDDAGGDRTDGGPATEDSSDDGSAEDSDAGSVAPTLLADAASNLRGPHGPDPLRGSSAGGVSASIYGTTIHATTVVLGGQTLGSDFTTPGAPGAAGPGRVGPRQQQNDAGQVPEDGGKKPRVRSDRWTAIPPDAVTWTATAFAEPSCFEVGRRQLERLNLAMVSGRPGFGRPSFAVAMLSQQVVRENIYRIDAQTDPRTIDFDKLPKNSGFLIENFDIQSLRGGAVRFDRLADDFRARGSYLVVTSRPQPDLLDVSRYIIDVQEPATATKIFKAQYSWFRDNPEGWVEPLGDVTRLPMDPLANDDVAGMLDTVVRVGQRASVVTELARRLAQAGLSEDIRRWVDGHLGDRFTSWISTVADPDEIAFVLALAILNGLSYRVVAEVAGAFAQDLQALAFDRRRDRTGDSDRDNCSRDGEEEGVVATGHGLLGPGRTALLRAAGAEIFEGTEDSGYGLAPADAVRFVTEGYARRVLDWVWREHVDIHEPITAWLSALSDHPSPQVRARAGAAAGLLATHGFDQVRRTMLLPWADTGRRREAVVSALRVLSAESEFAGHARRVALDWGTHRRHLGRQLAAVHAWGAGLGAETPALALDALADCVDTLPQPHTVDRLSHKFFGGAPLANAVIVSLLRLSVQGEAQASAVLERIAEWSTADDPRPRAVAAEGFLLLAARAVITDHESGWVRPLLLRLAMGGAVVADRVAALARHAFDTPYLNERTARVLHGWYARAEEDPELVPVLADVVIRIPHDETDERMIADLLEQWAPEFPTAVDRTFALPDGR